MAVCDFSEFARGAQPLLWDQVSVVRAFARIVYRSVPLLCFRNGRSVLARYGNGRSVWNCGNAAWHLAWRMDGESQTLMRAVFIVAMFAASAFGHVGSPDIFLDGNAGPYKLFITVRPPNVIPGVAELEVRSETGAV